MPIIQLFDRCRSAHPPRKSNGLTGGRHCLLTCGKTRAKPALQSKPATTATAAAATVAATATATGAIGLRLGFIDLQRATAAVLAVEGRDSSLGLLGGG